MRINYIEKKILSWIFFFAGCMILPGCITKQAVYDVQDFSSGFKQLKSDISCDGQLIAKDGLLENLKSALLTYLETDNEFRETIEYINYDWSPIVRSRINGDELQVKFFFDTVLSELAATTMIHGGISVVMNPCEKKVEYISEFRWGN